jgi:protein-S-isoprenylcysteine O-methyltransferase Ste14
MVTYLHCADAIPFLSAAGKLPSIADFLIPIGEFNMKSLLAVWQSKWANLYTAILLSTIWGLFASAHWSGYQRTHDAALLFIVISETLTAGFFIFRIAPKSVSVKPFDWLVALGGTFIPLFFRPAEWGFFPFANNLIIVGTLLQIVSLISLNRSFALVAACREIKTKGMYRLVRHPIYASYCVIFCGYVLSNTTLENLLLYIIFMAFLCLRILREERHLAINQIYRNYMDKVRYRLVPFIF